jgi:hypothetical protein
LQHHSLGPHDRAFQTFVLCILTFPSRALHISASGHSGTKDTETRAAYAANQARPTPNTQQPARPAFILRLLPAPIVPNTQQLARPAFILRLLPAPVVLRFLHHLRIFGSCLLHLVAFVHRHSLTCSLAPSFPPPLPVAASSFVLVSATAPRSRLLCLRSPGTTPSHRIILAGTTDRQTSSHVVGCAIADSWPSSLLNQGLPIRKHSQPPSPCPSVRSEVGYATLKMVIGKC